MDTHKGLIFSAIFLFLAIPATNAQSEGTSNATRIDSVPLDLVMAAEVSDDTAYIRGILKQNPNFTQKGKFGLDALENAYHYGNLNTFNVLLDYILAQNDTAVIKSSNILSSAISRGDTTTAAKLLSFYKPKLTSKDITEVFRGYHGFVFVYDYKNRYRNNNEFKDYDFYNTKDFDLILAGFLKNHGVDFNSRDTNGQNILYYCGIYPVVSKFFIEQDWGIKINQKDRYKNTFLDYYLVGVAYPTQVTFAENDEYEKEHGTYKKQLDLLEYYLSKGAVLGSGKKNAWKQLLKMSMKNGNDYLTYFIKTNYGERIK